MLGLNEGTLLGQHYQIKRAIGSGGMGAVYLAEDLRYDAFPTAIKVLYPGVVKTEDARERFRNEIIVSYRITHRNVVRAYEYFDEDELQAYAMEYVEGQDLQERMEKGRVPIPECQEILKQIAGGLHAIHQEGILHRDLKPENVMLNSAGLVKIADFGVARLKETNVSLTQTGALVGTPKYFAPEYIETGNCDQRSDVYALGIIGYELITGQSPFRAESQVSMMVERLKRRISPLSMVEERCPKILAAIIYKAMATDPDDRYATAQAMREDLELLIRGDNLNHASTGQLEAYEEQIRKEGEDLIPGSTTPSKFGVTINREETTVDAQVPQEVVKEPKASSGHTQMLISSFIIAFFMFLCGLAGFYAVRTYDLSFLDFRSTVLDDLQPGVYRGSVSGLLPGDTVIELRVWRSSRSIELWLLAEGCKKERLSARGAYNCGGAVYTFIPRYIDEQSAVGDLKIGTSDVLVKWSLVKSSTPGTTTK